MSEEGIRVEPYEVRGSLWWRAVDPDTREEAYAASPEGAVERLRWMQRIRRGEVGGSRGPSDLRKEG